MPKPLANHVALVAGATRGAGRGIAVELGAAGATVYTGSYTANAGTQNFIWDGRGNDGTLWPDGAYTLSATAVDTNGQSVGVSSEVQATVDSVDLTQDPPQMSINGQNYGMDKIKRIVRTGA